MEGSIFPGEGQKIFPEVKAACVDLHRFPTGAPPLERRNCAPATQASLHWGTFEGQGALGMASPRDERGECQPKRCYSTFMLIAFSLIYGQRGFERLPLC